MFAASTDQADRVYSISERLFLCLDGSLYPKDIRLSIPFMAILTYGMICLLGRRWEETAFLVSIHFKFIHSMTKQDEICNAGNNSTRTATSAHETSKYPTPELQSAFNTGRSKKVFKNVCVFEKVRTFAVRQFHFIRLADFLCPYYTAVLKYKSRGSHTFRSARSIWGCRKPRILCFFYVLN